MAEIQLPITVQKLAFSERDVHQPRCLFGGTCGDFVAVRPCAPEFEDQTFLGILLGEVALSQVVSFSADGTLTVGRYRYNPMIYIPQRKAVVWGCGSWWGRIERPEQLHQITDVEIQSVWYVQALAALRAATADPSSAEAIRRARRRRTDRGLDRDIR